MSKTASGRLGIEFGSYGPEIDMLFPSADINIPHIIYLRPYVRARIQPIASAVEGSVTMSFGTKIVPDTAEVIFDLEAEQDQVTSHD
jgi:hypothetical protein